MLELPLRAVLFDIGETLWHAPSPPPPAFFRELAAERARDFLEAQGMETSRADEFARVAWRAVEEGMAAARFGDLVEPDYADLARQALLAAGLEVDRAQAAAFLDAIYVSGAEGGKRALDDAAEVLHELKQRGFLIASVTNRAFGGKRFRQDLDEAGLGEIWDAHAVSVEVGYLKPHAAIFQHALSALGVEAGESLMVGNSLVEDVAGAAMLGIHTAWRRCVPDGEGITPDFAFENLRELLALPCLESAG